MAERIKDAEDRLLESMFESVPVADDGFSVKVLRQVTRRSWIRRVTLPTAAVIGGLLALKPLTGLASAIATIASFVPPELVNSTTTAIPQLQTIVLGAMLLAACLLGARTLAD